MSTKTYWHWIKELFSEWSQDNAPRLGAALAYYAGFSIAPLIVIVLAGASLIFGKDAATGALNSQLRELIGEQGAQAVAGLVASADKPAEGIIATICAMVVLLFGASGVFGELQSSLNSIWHVDQTVAGFWQNVKNRFLSFAMVLGTGFLLLISLVVSAALAAATKSLSASVPLPIWLMQSIHQLISFVITALLFALIFKILPDVEIRWKDVWIGAIATAGLFTIGKYLIGLYLGQSAVASSYGAAGSFVVLLVWVYYSAQILFLGAEFTKIHARTYSASSPDSRK
ncbi:MAG TPA: YihY/virulence factor BrkB family protein [Pirellulales bacterium]|jgi:membrane protein|nr:YihY/virulence factor BrkB family protein [Pirellulales bacterium]